MAKGRGKGNLKAGLRSLEARKATEAKVKRAEEAAKRKADSIVGVSKKRKAKQAAPPSEAGSNKGRPRPTYPFDEDDAILLVGEGDFSFALSLLSAPHCHPGHQVCATSYDSESTCLSKYPTTAPDNIASLRQRGCRVEFGVDAGSPEALLKLTARLAARWSKVVFNFPHVGQGHKDEGRNVLANQALLIRFLVAAAPCLSRGDAPRYVTGGSGVGKGKEREGSVSSVEEEANDDELDEMPLGDEEEEEDQGQIPPKKEAKVGLVTPSRAGSVLITLRNCPPYTKWDVGMLAKQLVLVCEPTIRSAPALPKGQHPPSQAQLQAVRELASSEKGFKVWRSFAFDKTLWKGYEHRRTLGWKPSWQDVTQKGLSGREEDDLGQQECRTWELGLQ